MFINFEKYLNKALPENPTFIEVGANKEQRMEQNEY